MLLCRKVSNYSFLQYCRGLTWLLQPLPGASSCNSGEAMPAVWVESPWLGVRRFGWKPLVWPERLCTPSLLIGRLLMLSASKCACQNSSAGAAWCDLSCHSPKRRAESTLCSSQDCSTQYGIACSVQPTPKSNCLMAWQDLNHLVRVPSW